MVINEISLHDFLEEQEQIKEHFVVDSPEKANWVLRKIKALQSKKAGNIALAESEIEKIYAWLEMVNGQIDWDLDYLTGLLTAYANELRHEDPEFKSMNLPNGKIGFRKQQPKWNYQEKTLVQSLKDLGRIDLIRIKEEPDKNGLRKAFKIQGNRVVDPETGMVIDGVSVEHREDELKIEIVK
ncbi:MULTISPECIES: host-nuclease inhibitor Gam family protein [unclassified Thermoactinomyces]|uniref:host-nuclease inhibitor Gam family protein n=1 Tax=unclassified Thermoactinomyces TaxID=2634588 RepID=UPI0018DE7BA3|nr:MULTISPECIES: host-nuclease inhibitor Gam family protein [unclassified Thermoactinomyces]MBH8599097.1 host-nuclease inhibitor Gam family protein [Thermoactinomyces sp. CICC 10523]MBH8607972.1 host-nuclease inhibitor Gam family protein [Thermoactinomyces sp. CICC 10521]